PCCGYGGLTQYTNREVAKKMTDKCLERSDLPYLSYCMACRDRFAREGRESMHLLELVYGTNADHCPDISAKRYNRLGLKQELLKEVWNEEVEAMELGFTIAYTPEAEEMMDDRMILKTDVIRVLQSLRETGEAILDEETGLTVTRARLGNVTFWVKFTETDTGYLIHRAYSHRMTIQPR
ncbi:MAG: aldehyde dehydrogenase, partial [Oscillospiraceae bacterium]|nr:aldehyde dehydrogenase [Oscillospiraceae bacterium]